MAVRTVPQPFATITAAISGAAAGDTIQVAQGYLGNETVTVTVTNLTVDAPATAVDIILVLGSGVQSIALTGAAEITVRGNGLNNAITGNAGANVLRGSIGNDTLNGGAEGDWSDYAQAAGAVTVTLTDPSVPGGPGGGSSSGADGVDTLISIERIRGSAFADTLIGNSDDNFIRGNAGNDTIDGRGGLDFVDYFVAVGPVEVRLTDATIAGGGTGGTSSGADGSDNLSNIENIRGSNFADMLFGNSGANVIRGGAGNDIIDGGAGRDTVDYSNATGGVSVTLTNSVNGRSGGSTAGADGSDTLIDVENIRGSDFNDVLVGNSSNNVINGRRGSDELDGREGIDTTNFTAARATYTIAKQAGAALALSVSAAGDTDTLRNIERLTFTDGILAFDTDAPAGPDGLAGVAYRVYQAAFGRTPDIGGLSFWTKQLDDGKIDAFSMAAGFINTPEFETLYGSRQPSTDVFLTKIYQNVLGRLADEGGYNFWGSELNSGARTQAQVLAAFSDSAENRAIVAPAIADGIFLSNDYFLY